ncbi:MAG TPA: hypothetical protein PKW76_06225 [bacterium]|nr:hypothetical protein [bacterium]HPG45255.1 hypothetical protein [bacterium]HPM99026.1 hypothetical protein [bacterium]
MSLTEEKHIAVYALFSDCSMAKIMLATFERSGGDRPELDSLIDDVTMNKSAKRALNVALKHYQAYKLPRYPGYQIVWEFAGNAQALNNYIGTSAGLALFIRFLLLFLQAQFPNFASFSVAATGELGELSDQSAIHPIDAFPEKLNTAVALLKRGDKFFYPKDNEKEISDALRQKVAAKGLELYPVTSTFEVAKYVREWFPVEQKTWKRKLDSFFRFAKAHNKLMAFVCLFVLCGLLWNFFEQGMNQQELVAFVEKGEFESVPLERLRAAEDPDLRRLAHKTRTPLTLKCDFVYLDHDRPRLQDASSLNLMQNANLNSEAGYRFEVLAEMRCFFYLFQFEGNTMVELLFPASSFDLENHFLQDQQLYFIPGGIQYFYFKVSHSRQLVTLIFLGSLWRARDIEILCRKYDQSQSLDKKKGYRDEILHRIQRRSQALDNGWEGLYVQKSYFWRQ